MKQTKRKRSGALLHLALWSLDKPLTFRHKSWLDHVETSHEVSALWPFNCILNKLPDMRRTSSADQYQQIWHLFLEIFLKQGEWAQSPAAAKQFLWQAREGFGRFVFKLVKYFCSMEVIRGGRKPLGRTKTSHPCARFCSSEPQMGGTMSFAESEHVMGVVSAPEQERKQANWPSCFQSSSLDCQQCGWRPFSLTLEYKRTLLWWKNDSNLRNIKYQSLVQITCS